MSRQEARESQPAHNETLSPKDSINIVVNYFRPHNGYPSNSEEVLTRGLNEIFADIERFFDGPIPPTAPDIFTLYEMFYKESANQEVELSSTPLDVKTNEPLENDGTDLEEPRIPALDKSLRDSGLKTTGFAEKTFKLAFKVSQSGRMPEDIITAKRLASVNSTPIPAKTRSTIPGNMRPNPFRPVTPFR